MNGRMTEREGEHGHGDWEEGDSWVTGGSKDMRGKIGHGAIEGEEAGWWRWPTCGNRG